VTTIARVARWVRRLVIGAVALCGLAALVAGVPWGLVRYIGWPLPEHIPTPSDIQVVLLAPMSVTLLLNLLACIAWPVWLVFVIDVVRCVVEALRGVPYPTVTAGPLRMVAASLVGAVALSLLSPRTTSPTPMTITYDISGTSTGAVTTYQMPDIHLSSLHATLPDHGATPQPDTVVVQEPQHGIHDSLWRIAERELGDGSRWPEIWDLNKGKTMADGRVFTDPNLIQPQWLLTTPTPPAAPTPTADHAGGAQEGSSAHTTAPPTASPTPPAPTPTSPAPAAKPAPEVTATPDPGVLLTTGGFVALGLAGAVTAALTIRRLRRRRRYHPGSTNPEPEPMAPVVRALRIVHDRSLDVDDLDITTVDGHTTPRPVRPATPAPVAPSGPTPVGVRDGRTHAIELAQLRGLGLTGAGADAAARALLVHILATSDATVIMPAADASSLLGNDAVASSRLRVVDHVDTAVAELGREVRDRTQNAASAGIVLVATGGTPPNARLQAVLDNGGTCHITGILLGYWPAGGTIRVRPDGIVGAASPGLNDVLLGTQLFHLDANDTRDLIELFTDAAPKLPAPRAELDGIQPRLNQNARSATRDEKPSDLVVSNGDSSASEATNRDDTERAAGRDHTHLPSGALSILGPFALTWRSDHREPQDIDAALARKHRHLLIFLALHPEGATREAIREALWPTARGPKPLNAFYATVSQIRGKLTELIDSEAGEIIELRGERVALRTDLISVDYWELLDAEHALHVATDDTARHAALSRIAATYRGELAEGTSELWLDGPREATHRSAVNALAELAATYRKTDPQRRLQILEHARVLDQYNENIYRDIMRTQAELGLPDSVNRTLTLLTTALAEIGDQADASTVTLAQDLQHPYRQTTPQ
jgi:DNA-binding SARP family transcriptional activator